MFVYTTLPKPLFNSSLRTIKKALSTKLFEEELVYINSQKINYLRVGDGSRSILCFPGLCGTIWSDFKLQIEGLDRKKFTIIAWDPPGHGYSRPRETKLSSKFYEEDADTAYELMKALGLKYFSLLGWSDGGVSSLILAGKYPQVIEKLIIWGANSYLVPKDVEAIEKIRDIKKWSERAVKPFIKMYGEETLQELMNSHCDVLKEILANGGDICESLVKNIQCPSLILHGDKDSVIDPVHPGHLKENIKGARLHRFPQGKHNIHLQYAEEFNNIVTDFLLNGSKL